MSACPHCDSTKGFTRIETVIGKHEGGDDIVQESISCKSCRQSIDIRSGPRGQLAIEDDIARLQAKLRRTGSDSIRRVIASRQKRLRQQYGSSH